MATVTGFPVMKPSSGSEEQRTARLAFPNEWPVGALETPCKKPGYFCLSALAPWCMSYNLRRRALYGDMSRYVCCGGAFPCSGSCGEQKAPELCLACETCCCFPTSVAVTRFILQDQGGIRDSPTDTCLIGTQFALSQCAFCCSLAACLTGSEELAQAANCLTCAADVGWCLLCGCLQAQHADVLDRRDRGELTFSSGPTQVTPPGIQVMPAARLGPAVPEGSRESSPVK